MNNFLSYLNPQQSSQLEEIVSKLISRFQPEKIYCFGSRIENSARFSCFMPEQKQESIQFDLLMITSCIPVHEPQHYINSRYIKGKITILNHSARALNAALQLKHPFFIRVYEEGQLLYLSDQKTEISPEAMAPTIFLKSRFNYQAHFTQATEHLQTAKQTQQDHPQALNRIRESVKQICIGLIQTYMQYYCSRLSLCQLMSLCRNFSTVTEECFPQNKPEEIRLVHLLLKIHPKTT